jgi:hypothetical protein
MLIDRAILRSELKKRGISVDEFEIENEMEKIANKNGLSLFEFKDILNQRGELNQFKEALKDKLLKEKLFNEIIKGKLNISDTEMKNYYENHKNEFKVFKTIQVVKYSANNPELLKKVKKNPLFSNSNVKIQTKSFYYNEIPLNKLFLFKSTDIGKFTPIINEGDKYVMYYIARKDGEIVLPFNKVKTLIANKLAAMKREEILKEYFSKLKNKADIQIYH